MTGRSSGAPRVAVRLRTGSGSVEPTGAARSVTYRKIDQHFERRSSAPSPLAPRHSSRPFSTLGQDTRIRGRLFCWPALVLAVSTWWLWSDALLRWRTGLPASPYPIDNAHLPASGKLRKIWLGWAHTRSSRWHSPGGDRSPVGQPVGQPWHAHKTPAVSRAGVRLKGHELATLYKSLTTADQSGVKVWYDRYRGQLLEKDIERTSHYFVQLRYLHQYELRRIESMIAGRTADSLYRHCATVLGQPIQMDEFWS
jgi:hypothetical protein